MRHSDSGRSWRLEAGFLEGVLGTAPSCGCGRLLQRRVRWWAFTAALSLVWLLPGPAGAAVMAFEGAPASGDSDCLPAVVRTASPALVTMGDTINVNVRLRFACPERSHPYHLAVVADSGALDGRGRLIEPLTSLDNLVVRLAVAAHPHVKAGLASFGARSGIWCGLSNDARTVATCFASFGLTRANPVIPSPSMWSLGDALRSATDRLVNQRDGRVGSPQHDGILVIARAPETACEAGNRCDAAAECATAQLAADRAVAQGIELSVACVGAGCSSSCLQHLPVPGSYYPPGGWPEALQRQDDLARSSHLGVTRVRLTDVAPAGIEPDPATFDPPGATYDPVTRSVLWSEALLPAGNELSFAYAAVADRPGRMLLAQGVGSLDDSMGRSRSFVVPDRHVTAALVLTTLSLPRLYSYEARVHP